MNPLQALPLLGQSVWLDFMRRSLVGPELERFIAEDGVVGITSNPAIFERALSQSADYDAPLDKILRQGDQGPMALYETVAIRDVQLAADRLLPIYRSSKRREGYVSLEVSPHLAHDAQATLQEARRLWQRVGRPNLMVKIPATAAGIAAIEGLIADGINVNATLIFDRATYGRVADAFRTGLERRATHQFDLSAVASVASIFISRIDLAVDRRLREAHDKTEIVTQRAKLSAALGTVGILTAQSCYAHYRTLTNSAAWKRLAERGAQTQRLLWASTGCQDPAYGATYYVDRLIGPDTINTMEPETMSVFRNHGTARGALLDGLDLADTRLQALKSNGIDVASITTHLQQDGIVQFRDAFDRLLQTVETKRRTHLGQRLVKLETTLPTEIGTAVADEIERWRVEGRVQRLWQKDASLWTDEDEENWLGWLHAVPPSQSLFESLDRLATLATGFEHVVLLGMGGSSLGPEVISAILPRAPGAPQLIVLDSTDPTQIRLVDAQIDPGNTLFIFSSKAGATLEPNILKLHFFERVRKRLGAEQAAQRFIAVTDPGSPLEKMAHDEGFAKLFRGEASIGGRYSVLSAFGLVPAAACGIDIKRFLDETAVMVRSCGADVPAPLNPGVRLGAILGIAAQQGRDKLTLIPGPGLEAFGVWVEQLVAESTGKDGIAIIPVDGEPLGSPAAYGHDRLFIHLSLRDAPDPRQGELDTLAAFGHPIVRLVLADPYQLGQAFFHWEMATAVAGSILGINPFDQPDVEASKVATRSLTDGYERDGHLPDEAPFFETDGIRLYADPNNTEALLDAATHSDLSAVLAAHFSRANPGDYAALLAYIPRTAKTEAALTELRAIMRDALSIATVVGFGPRFLHSTGQAYKGGPNTGLFLQITCDDVADLAVPHRRYTFGVVKAAQARGDFDVLAERGRRALRLHLGPNLDGGLRDLTQAVRAALAEVAAQRTSVEAQSA